MAFDPNRQVGFESRKSYSRRCQSGFWDRWMKLPAFDIGYRGGTLDAVPIIDGAAGIELDTPGYDGLHLPAEDETIAAVHASHVLEHVPDPLASLGEWFRVLRTGGALIVTVPHAYLYERRLTVPPSRWSGEHLRSYTPASLLTSIERALPPNTYRVRVCEDEDTDYDYNLPTDRHPQGCLEILLVLEKIKPPLWYVEP